MINHRRFRTTIPPLLLALVLPFTTITAAASQTVDTQQYRQLVEDIQQASRGPFSHLRWFCHDGSARLPSQGNCSARGGGIQHGEWSADTRKLRGAGYLVANVLADYSVPHSAPLRSLNNTDFKQILLERFLVARNEGWIFNKAQYYRGGLQVEDELAGANALRYWAVTNLETESQEYLLIREAFRLLPRQIEIASAERVRNMATQIAARDTKFEPLRIKLHGMPQPTDEQQIRDYAAASGKPALQEKYTALADALAALFQPDLTASHQTWLRSLNDPGLVGKFHYLYDSLEQASEPMEKLHLMSDILSGIRDGMVGQHQVVQQRMLNASLDLETYFYAVANQLQPELQSASRQQRLQALQAVLGGQYGQGFISKRQWLEADSAVTRLLAGTPTLAAYREGLQSLNRLPSWATRWMNFHFNKPISHLADIEIDSLQFIPARLRGSSLQFYTDVLDGLLQDANQTAGVTNRIFDQQTGTGIRALNAGLARGILKIALDPDEALDPNGIYVLPHTTAELTPVAGIITQGEGNALSHVQLLAANLGIPNIVVDDSIKKSLQAYEGKQVTLAVSPAGMVEIKLADAADESLFAAKKGAPPEVSIVPDLSKLDLRHTGLKKLSELRSRDSGRIAGPKAANLGELKHFFPFSVAEGVVIPFGIFNTLLDRPMRGKSGSIRDWMMKNYAQIAKQEGELRTLTTDIILKELRYHLEHIELDEVFDSQLRETLQAVFGDDGSYAVFVRSDTNIEDLPGFTGAGLNLTVPNVVGVDNIIQAVKRVWASPFTDRAFAWRQGRMDNPEHVYPSILLMKTVPVQKSGVMLTLDTESGDSGKYSVAVNRGIGGVVAGQSAEELLLDADSYAVQLRQEATSPTIKIIDKLGGLKKIAAPANGAVLSSKEVVKLLALGRQAEGLLPQYDEQGELTPADIEFGFLDGDVQLFQIRPYLRNKRAHQHQYLLDMDAGLAGNENLTIDLTKTPDV